MYVMVIQMVSKENYENMSPEQKLFFVTKKIKIISKLETEINNFCPTVNTIEDYNEILQDKIAEFERRKTALKHVL